MKTRLISGTDLTEKDLDPEFARGNSLIPTRDIGMNLRCQLFPVSRDETQSAAGLIRYLGISSVGEFNLEKACTHLINHESRPLDFHFPVIFNNLDDSIFFSNFRSADLDIKVFFSNICAISWIPFLVKMLQLSMLNAN